MNDSHELTFGDLYPTEFLFKTNHFFANLPDTFRELSCSNLLIVLNIEKVVTVPKLTIKFKVFRWIMAKFLINKIFRILPLSLPQCAVFLV